MARRRSDPFSQRDAPALIRIFGQLPRQAQIVIGCILLVMLLVTAVVEFRKAHPARPSALPGVVSATLDANLFLGNPSDATASILHPDNYLLDKTYYAVSYNNETGAANWVSWRLTSADLGTAPRKPEFDPDDTLPINLKHIVTRDYVGSGFDRGHLCPHGDRSASLAESYATFCMTNIIPQGHRLNEGIWNDQERYLQNLARSGHRLYIVAGPLGSGGVGGASLRKTIAGGRVTVPAMCWKIAVVTDETGGADDLTRITAATRVIAVLIPNDDTALRYPWSGYRVMPSAIEQKTGLHFFSRLPAEVRAKLEAKVDAEAIASVGGRD